MQTSIYSCPLTIQWKEGDQLDRVGGPAVINESGLKVWFAQGREHRTDGPAVIWSDKSESYCIHGRWYTKKNFRKHLKERKCNPQSKGTFVP